jgi:hypothetical protein
MKRLSVQSGFADSGAQTLYRLEDGRFIGLQPFLPGAFLQGTTDAT